MALDTLSNTSIAKVKTFIDESLRIFLEIEDLKGGLSDLSKTLAEELGVKPSQLMGAARAAHKQSLEDTKENVDIIEEILVVAGRA
ncbi:MAG: hypothetical protein EOO77_29060 [Oxalobacteraceae bacterium]|jgi:hypothetical protein|nr:MAG: hypothetical protein EOO77_29060 [Oxalobacteraceae bacterium]